MEQSDGSSENREDTRLGSLFANLRGPSSSSKEETTARDETGTLNSRLDKLEETIKNLANANVVADLSAKQDKFHEEISALKSSLGEIQNKIKDTGNQYINTDFLENKIADVRKQVENLVSEINDRINRLFLEIKKSNEAKATGIEDNIGQIKDELTNKISGLSHKSDNLESALIPETKNEILEILNSKFEEMKNKTFEETGLAKKEINELKKNISQLSRKSDNLESALIPETKNEILEILNSKFEEMKNKTSNETELTKKETNELKKNISELSRKSDNLESVLVPEIKNEILEILNSRLEEMKNKTFEETELAKTEINELKKNISQLSRKSDNLESALIPEIKNEILEILNSKFEEMKNKTSNETELAKKEINELKKNISELSRKSDNLESVLVPEIKNEILKIFNSRFEEMKDTISDELKLIGAKITELEKKFLQVDNELSRFAETSNEVKNIKAKLYLLMKEFNSVLGPKLSTLESKHSIIDYLSSTSKLLSEKIQKLSDQIKN